MWVSIPVNMGVNIRPWIKALFSWSYLANGVVHLVELQWISDQICTAQKPVEQDEVWSVSFFFNSFIKWCSIEFHEVKFSFRLSDFCSLVSCLFNRLQTFTVAWNLLLLLEHTYYGKIGLEFSLICWEDDLMSLPELFVLWFVFSFLVMNCSCIWKL